MAESGFAEVNGTTLHYEVTGAGEPLVMIHGGGVDRRVWDSQLRPLGQYYRVIAYDRRGYGRSALPTAPYSDVADLRALLDHLGIERSAWIGSSVGGGIALDAALELRERVGALVLIAPFLGGYSHSPGLRRRTHGLLEAYRAEGAEGLARELLADRHFPPAPGNIMARRHLRTLVMDNAHVFGLEWTGGEPLDPPAVERLGEIGVPVLVLIGSRDDADNRAVVDRLVAGIPEARKAIVPGAGHLAQLDKPEELNQIVLRFLQQHRFDAG